ncbi:DUF6678 family protein [Pleionea sediminis]|uniref:DUF6678 family protein n=1 Tax=Pleionea sediminis TaxID=2569479 RepID=UPI0011847506|nr:DUF6678 family protein [Pleionea sediminis]
MENSNWESLFQAIKSELPFTPPFQYKKYEEPPYPEVFDEDVWYLGDYSSEFLLPYSKLEWIAIRPRYLKSIGRLLPQKIVSCEQELLALLNKLNINFKNENDKVFIRSSS